MGIRSILNLLDRAQGSGKKGGKKKKKKAPPGKRLNHESENSAKGTVTNG